MESRLFIKAVAELTRRIKDAAVLATIGNGDSSETDAIQKAIHTTFAGLQNPTLPSAGKLIDAAREHGYDVDPRVLHRVAAAESCWGN